MGAVTADLQIAKPITLKCGLTLPNRLVKAAMVEAMGSGDNLPNEKITALYKRWAEGGWGMVLTGNVQVDALYLGSPQDIAMDAAIPEATIIEAFSAYAQAAKGSANTPAVVQLNHPGRQSPLGAGRRGFLDKSLAPSAIDLKLGNGMVAWLLTKLVFGTPRAMTATEIETVIEQFARGARISAEAGFAGVEIHAAHGYLLAQFLSASSNQRTDAYGGSPEARAKIVVDIVHAIRRATADHKNFCVGIKLNSVDHQSAADLRDCIAQLKLITDAGVDFVEVSGGTYEDPQMMLGTKPVEEKKSDRTKVREAFFLEFARAIRSEFPNVHLMVTGGFRSRLGMEAAVASGDCETVGLGRPAVLNPSLPHNIVFNPEISDADATLYARKVEIPWIAKKLGMIGLGAGAVTKWYTSQMNEDVKQVVAN